MARPASSTIQACSFGSPGDIQLLNFFFNTGSQALKALHEAGVVSVLMNPNIATIQTSHYLADEVYMLPVTPEYVEYVIQRERPDGIFLSFGGQTALNLGVSMANYPGGSLLEKYGVKVLGTSVRTLELSEVHSARFLPTTKRMSLTRCNVQDRDLFARALDEINIPIAKSIAVSTVDEALDAAEKIGYPIIVRAAYALGGLGMILVGSSNPLEIDAANTSWYLGSGFANNREEVCTN